LGDLKFNEQLLRRLKDIRQQGMQQYFKEYSRL